MLRTILIRMTVSYTHLDVYKRQVQMDKVYYDNLSFAFDVKCLFMTCLLYTSRCV